MWHRNLGLYNHSHKWKLINYGNSVRVSKYNWTIVYHNYIIMTVLKRERGLWECAFLIVLQWIVGANSSYTSSCGLMSLPKCSSKWRWHQPKKSAPSFQVLSGRVPKPCPNHGKISKTNAHLDDIHEMWLSSTGQPLMDLHWCVFVPLVLGFLGRSCKNRKNTKKTSQCFVLLFFQLIFWGGLCLI